MHLRGIRSRTALRNFAIPCPVVNPLKRGPEMASFFQLSIDHHQPDTKGLTKQISQNGTSGTSMVKYPDTLFAVYSTPSSRERPGTQVKKLLSEQKVESRNAIIKEHAVRTAENRCYKRNVQAKESPNPLPKSSSKRIMPPPPMQYS